MDQRRLEVVLPGGQRIALPGRGNAVDGSRRESQRWRSPAAPDLEESEEDDDTSDGSEDNEDEGDLKPLATTSAKPRASRSSQSNGMDEGHIAQMRSLSMKSPSFVNSGSGTQLINTYMDKFQAIQNTKVAASALSPTPLFGNNSKGREPFFPPPSSTQVGEPVSRPDITLFTARVLGNTMAKGKYDTGTDDNFVTRHLVDRVGGQPRMQKSVAAFEGANRQNTYSSHTILWHWIDSENRARVTQCFVMEDLGEYDMLLGRIYIQENNVFTVPERKEAEARPLFQLMRKTQTEEERAAQEARQIQQSTEAAAAREARLAQSRAARPTPAQQPNESRQSSADDKRALFVDLVMRRGYSRSQAEAMLAQRMA